MTNDFWAVSDLIAKFRAKLDLILWREGKRHEMDAHLPFDLRDLLENALVPVLDAAIASIEYDPTDEDLGGGEPPVTMAEMHAATHVQHIAMHS